MAEGDKPTSEDRSFWSLSPDDQHALWVNFLGTIASGVVLAVLLGGAIALARATKYTPLWLLVTLTVVPCLMLIPPVQKYSAFRRRQGTYATEKARRAYVGIVVVGVLFLALEVLIWVGRAAGIGK